MIVGQKGIGVFSDALFAEPKNSSASLFPSTGEWISWLRPYSLSSLARLRELGSELVLIFCGDVPKDISLWKTLCEREGIVWAAFWSEAELASHLNAGESGGGGALGAASAQSQGQGQGQQWQPRVTCGAWVLGEKSFDRWAGKLIQAIPASPQVQAPASFIPAPASSTQTSVLSRQSASSDLSEDSTSSPVKEGSHSVDSSHSPETFSWVPLAKPLGIYVLDVVGDHDIWGQRMAALKKQLSTDRLSSLRVSGWRELAESIATMDRVAEIVRQTSETTIAVSLNLDGSGQSTVQTGLGFFDHMLENFARHANIDLRLTAWGDLHIDEHHTIEDTALTLGETFKRALGEKRGITRYAFHLPMDESAVSCLLDLSGRSVVVWSDHLRRERVGDFPTEMAKHFFESLATAGGFNLNMTLRGENDHHQIEAAFKALARCLRAAVERGSSRAIPSTKGGL